MVISNNGLNESVCQSYLLRVWRDSEDGEWRATLLTIPTQERHQFTSMEGLFNFLEYRVDHPVQKTPLSGADPGLKTAKEVTDSKPG
jgi:hypothetical protein